MGTHTESASVKLDFINGQGCREVLQNVLLFGEFVSVRVASTGAAVEEWFQQLSPSDHEFGLDIEWRPSRQGENNKPATLQLASSNGCLIIQLMYLDYFPESLVDLLKDRKRQLAGVGVQGDAQLLLNTHHLLSNGTVELGQLASNTLGSHEMLHFGLARLYTVVFDTPFVKDKGITMSDWSIPQLSVEQIQYAACDAWASFKLLQRLNSIISLSALPFFSSELD